MYILKNAMKNLARNSKRNLIIAGITAAVIVSAVVSVTINNTANRIIADARLDIGSRVDIGIDLFDLNALGLGPGGRENLTLDEYLAFGESEYLAHASFLVEMPAFSSTLFAIDDDSFGTTASPDASMANMMTMKLIGATDLYNLPDFGTDRHIIDGRMFEGINEVIISADLAAHNDVAVGDVITIESVFHPVQIFELTVAGIYSDATPEYTDWWMQMFGRFNENRRNEILTSFETLTAAGFTDDRALHVRAEYFLRNPDYLPRFEAEVRALGLPDIFGVTINQDALDVVTGPLNSMRSTALIFTLIVLALGAIVLTLISYMAIRERKYEIGVLRAMGMGKAKISTGIFLETAAITAVCLVIGLGAGSLAAQPVADTLLAGEVAAAEEAVGEDTGRFLMAGGQAQTENTAAGFVPISDIETALSTETITQIVLIAFGLAVLSSLIAIAAITKYEPMRILSNRE